MCVRVRVCACVTEGELVCAIMCVSERRKDVFILCVNKMHVCMRV